MAEAVSPAHRNDVVIVGTCSGEPELRTLPSGDEIVTCRVTVKRAYTPAGGDGHDTLECTAWTARLQRTIKTWRPGDLVEVEGAIRRRFYRTAVGAASSYGVEVSRARRLSTVLTRPRTSG